MMNEEISSIVPAEPTGDLYLDLAAQAAALFEGERDFIANAANLSSLLFHAMAEVNWCGVYLVRGDELVLGPFQGKVACVRIPIGRGVCGTSAGSRRTLCVPDVNAFPGHIACDSESRSEIVVPLLGTGGGLVGVLDIDSPSRGRFDDQDAAGLERVSALLVASSNTPAGI